MSRYFRWKWLSYLQNSGDPDQMPHYVASDLGLHFLPIPLSVNNILFKHTDTYIINIDNLHTQTYITVI